MVRIVSAVASARCQAPCDPSLLVESTSFQTRGAALHAYHLASRHVPRSEEMPGSFVKLQFEEGEVDFVASFDAISATGYQPTQSHCVQVATAFLSGWGAMTNWSLASRAAAQTRAARL